jgi:hypothetical protein
VFDEEEIDREEDIPPEVECTGTISVQQPLQGIEETQEHVEGYCDNLDHQTDESEGDADAQSQYSSGGTVLSPEVMFRGFQLR